MLVTLSLVLPGEAGSVRVARRMLASTLDVLGVAEDEVFEICLALTEACTNVVDHADAEQGYEVVVEVDDDRCRMTVTDSGRGFQPELFGPGGDRPRDSDAGAGGERGRGISLIQALTDRFGISSGPGEGVIVFLERRLPDVSIPGARDRPENPAGAATGGH